MSKNTVKEPAKISYFFGESYGDLWRTVKTLWSKNGERISNAWSDIGDSWSSDGKYIAVCLFIFRICILISLAIFGTIFTLIFSLIHISILLVLMAFVYLGFILARVFDGAFCLLKGISTNCYNPQCERKFVLPIYVCPRCHKLHYHLVPSKYGILKRRCLCGEKLPTTFFNGRQKLDSLCPHCQSDAIKGVHSSILVPVIGSTSSGKTCFVNMAINGLEKSVGASKKLKFEYQHVHGDEYVNNIAIMNDGNLPPKTGDLRFKYYNFYLSQKESKVENLISVCDIAGEVFLNQDSVVEQQGFRFADALLCIIDPLSIDEFRDEVKGKINYDQYAGSTQSMSEILSGIINTLESLFRKGSKQILKMNICVVLTKSDIPGLDEKVGEEAVREYMANNSKATVEEANNVVCEQFFRDYGETSFVNEIKGKFKEVQFYAVSALGHVPSGQKFTPRNVVKPLAWVVNKTCPNLNLLKEIK